MSSLTEQIAELAASDQRLTRLICRLVDGHDALVAGKNQEIERLRAAIERVRHRHRPVEPDHPLGPRCAHCRTDFPCAELRALDGPEGL